MKNNFLELKSLLTPKIEILHNGLEVLEEAKKYYSFFSPNDLDEAKTSAYALCNKI